MRAITPIFLLCLSSGPLFAQFANPALILLTQGRRFGRVATADLNNDQLPDLLAVDDYDKLYLYWNLGQKLAAEPILLADGLSFIEPVRIADLNLDGAPDILFQVEGEQSVRRSWQLRNDPDNPGAFVREPLLPASPPRSVELVGDFNGDGAPDLIARRAPNSIQDTVFLYTNNGEGGFTSEQILPTQYDPLLSDLQAQDMDGDQDLDLLFRNGYTIAYWENTDGGQLVNQKVYAEINSVGNYNFVSGDFNGDGWGDILAVQVNSQWGNWARVYMNRGEAGFERIDLYPENAGNSTWFPFLTGDFTGDGIDDILVRKNDRLTTFQYAQGTFTEVGSTESQPVFNQNGLTVDWNNDGSLDVLIFAGNRMLLIPGRNDGSFSSAYTINPEIASVFATGHADLDRDGDEDLFFVSGFDNKVGWKSNEGDGTFGPTVLISSNLRAPYIIYAADLDQNGYPDLIVSDFNRLITGYYNEGDAQFREGATLAPGRLRGPPSDLDGDGQLDLILTDTTGSAVHWSRNNGAGFDPSQSLSLPPGLVSSPLLFEDLDQDGDLDIYTYADGFTLWMRNGGDLDYSIAAILGDVSGDTDLRIADLDNDGRPDLIYSTGARQIAWHRNTGGGFSAPQFIADEQNCPLTISVADFDNDGDQDIVGTIGTNDPCANENNTVFFENQGNGAFSRLDYAVDMVGYPSGTYPVEIDGDGRLDLLSFNSKGINWRKNLLDVPTISGYCFWDQNANGERESEEPLLPGIGIEISPSALLTFTDENGFYRFYLDPGAYAATFDPPPCWELTSDSTTYHFTIGDNTQDFFAFGFQPADTARTLTAQLTTAPTRCNTLIPAWLSVRNDGCIPSSGQVSLVLDNISGLFYTDFPPDVQNGDSLLWVLDTLLPAETITIPLLLGIAGPEFLGDSVRLSYATSWPNATEQLIAGPPSKLTSELLCAYDPNDKLVDKTSVPKAYSPAEGTLRYTIRFQNTGNDTAFTVRLYDQLSSDLDWKSLKPISASHPYDLQLNQTTGELEFFFRDILLPDSTTNEPASHGYAAFSIQMRPGLQPGAMVQNQAEIYFDANPAIVTNVAETIIPQVVSNREPASDPDIALFPNPTNGRITAYLPRGRIATIQVKVFDLFGRSALTLETQNNQIDMSSLPSGVYLLRLQYDGRVSSRKVIRN